MLAFAAVGTWKLLFLALGLAMFLEGLPYFVSPKGVRRTLAAITRMRDAGLRWFGLTLMIAGLVVAYLSTR